MTQLQIELSDETVAAIREEADHFGISVEEYISRLMIKSHAFRVAYPLKQAQEYAKQVWRGEIPGEGIRYQIPLTSEKGV